MGKWVLVILENKNKKKVKRHLSSINMSRGQDSKSSPRK